MSSLHPSIPQIPEGPAVKVLDSLLHKALQDGASDIHVETGDNSCRVRFRIDGRLRLAATPAMSLRDALVSRIKVLARMDIAEKRLPQDGRIQYTHAGQGVDLRVSSLPTVHGEKVVIRILKFSQARPSLSSLGYEADDQARLVEAIERPHGMVLMTGPTGSGKTLSLYSCLDILNRPEINLSTVEDPSEIQLEGANQVNINERAGLTFANTLRALLRQDPDVIMLGEIRDLETAQIAIQASQTGHLVLSTLHTNDATSTLTRLHHMGVEPFNVAASVVLITAQRLVRRLCDGCKTPMHESQTREIRSALELTPQTIFSVEDIQTRPLFKPVGCHACDGGYKGRLGIFQVLPISDNMQSLILNHCSAQDMAKQASSEGVRNLREAGLLKVLHGLTSAQEVMALTQHG